MIRHKSQPDPVTPELRDALLRRDGWMTPEREKSEFVARSMDRLMATAKYGAQPKRPTRQTEITVATEDGPVSVAFTLSDTEAIFDEFSVDAPCGVCHQDRCRRGDEA